MGHIFFEDDHGARWRLDFDPTEGGDTVAVWRSAAGASMIRVGNIGPRSAGSLGAAADFIAARRRNAIDVSCGLALDRSGNYWELEPSSEGGGFEHWTSESAGADVLLEGPRR